MLRIFEKNKKKNKFCDLLKPVDYAMGFSIKRK